MLIDEEVDDSDDDDEEGYYVYCDVNNGICVDIFFCCVGNLVGYLIWRVNRDKRLLKWI